MKVCSKCKKELPLSAFNRLTKSKDGRKPYCRECQNKDHRLYYRRNLEAKQKYRDENKDKTKEYNDGYYMKNREYLILKERERRESNYEAYVSHYTIHSLKRSGNIEKEGNCELCGKYCKLDAHHPDYSKPTEIVQVCRSCHHKIHHGVENVINL